MVALLLYDDLNPPVYLSHAYSSSNKIDISCIHVKLSLCHDFTHTYKYSDTTDSLDNNIRTLYVYAACMLKESAY